MTPSPNYHPAAHSDHPVNWAKRYAGLGWRVVPVDSVSKIPCDPATGRPMAGWPKKATTDQATLEAWFANRPTIGVGVATGRISGIIVVDVDQKPGKNGEAGLRLLEGKLGALPSTLEALTPSGGRHLVFRYPACVDARISSPVHFGKDLIGQDSFVDIRADGAQINVEPTCRDGVSYLWQSNLATTDPAELPDFWIEELVGVRAQSSAPLLIGSQNAGGLPNKIAEGGRNDALTSYVGTMRAKGLEEQDLLALARAWNLQMCDPPLPDSEVEQVVRSVGKYPAGSGHWTERGHAQRFVDKHGDDIRHTPEVGWLAWNEEYWEPSRSDVKRRMLLLADDVRHQVDRIPAGDVHLKKAGNAWIKKVESKATIGNCLDLAEVLPGVPASINEFDADPYVFACQNAVIELRSGVGRGPAREDKITKRSPAVYEPSASAPRWEEFLNQIFANDRTLIEFVQTTMGYCMTGLNHEHNIWCSYGGGRNGKGVFFGVMTDVLGPYAQTTPRDTFTSSNFGGGIPNDLAALRGARMCVCDEFPIDKPPNEELMKLISGGGQLSARFLHKEFFQYSPTFKLFLVTNRRLKFGSTNRAFWERFLEIPFGVTIPREERNPRLQLELVAEERSGILNWLIEGARRYFAQGLNIPDVVRVASSAARLEADSVRGFLNDDVTSDAESFTASSAMHSAYRVWCIQNAYKPLGQRDLKSYLEDDVGLVFKKTSRANGWVGVKLSIR